MRRLIIALVLLLGLLVVITRFTEVELIVATLRRGVWWWLAAGLVVQGAWLITAAYTYKYLYRLLGLPGALPQLLPLVSASLFVNIVAPSAGMGGMAVFITDARHRGLSTPRVTIADVLYVLCEYFSFMCVLAGGLLVLFRRNHLTAVEIGASAALLGVALMLAALLALGASSPPRYERVLIWGARRVNRLLRPLARRDYLSEARAHEFAAETAEGLAALRTTPSAYLPPLALALLGKLLLIATLATVFLAFRVPFTAGTLVGGFSIGHLFVIVSPTPAGVGVVEGALTLGLNSLRVPLEEATVITLAYRGLTFWMPLAYGFAALRVLERRWHHRALERLGDEA
jgi:uncharacterized protein (TIRG00374 family)